MLAVEVASYLVVVLLVIVLVLAAILVVAAVLALVVLHALLFCCPRGAEGSSPRSPCPRMLSTFISTSMFLS